MSDRRIAFDGSAPALRMPSPQVPDVRAPEAAGSASETDAIAEPAGSNVRRAVAYIIVVPLGLLIGAFIGLVVALMSGMITIC